MHCLLPKKNINCNSLRTVGTAVHELTHHWLAEANPAYSRAEGRRSPRCAERSSARSAGSLRVPGSM